MNTQQQLERVADAIQSVFTAALYEQCRHAAEAVAALAPDEVDYPIYRGEFSLNPPEISEPIKPYVTAHSIEAADRVMRALSVLDNQDSTPSQAVSEEEAVGVMVPAFQWGNRPIPDAHKMAHVFRAIKAAGFNIVKGGE